MGRVDQCLQHLAAEHAGAIDLREAHRAGVSEGSIRRRVADGTLLQVHDRVCVLAGGAGLPVDTRAHAAVLQAGADAVVSHTSAFALQDAWRRWDGQVHITSSRNVGGRCPSDVTFHRSAKHIPESWRCVVRDIPVIAAPHACAQLGTELTEFQIAHVIGEARFRELLDPESVRIALEELGRPRGARRVRRALDLHESGSAGTRSGGEDRLLTGLLAAGAPEPFVNVRGSTGHAGIELDFVWRRERLVVAVDGGQHRWSHAAANDEEVDHVLRDAGWMPMHFTSRRVWWDLEGCVEEVMMQLRLRNPRRRRPRTAGGSRRA